MACYNPVTAQRDEGVIYFSYRSGRGVDISVPCGKCVGCYLTHAKGWAIRCMKEAKTHDENSFLTLTFDRDHCPSDGMLDKRVPQLFLKRLRKKIGKKVSYFLAGEYGGRFGRPHYHLLLFGYDFPDKREVTVRMGNTLFRSPELEVLWPFGFSSIGDVNMASASYVSRYCVKKVTERERFNYEKIDDIKWQIDKVSGEMKVAEFTLMSRRPAIAQKWFEMYGSDVFPSDEVIIDGRQERPPRYFDKQLDKVDPDMLESLKLERMKKVVRSESTPERLAVKEIVALDNLRKLKRGMED